MGSGSAKEKTLTANCKLTNVAELVRDVGHSLYHSSLLLMKTLYSTSYILQTRHIHIHNHEAFRFVIQHIIQLRREDVVHKLLGLGSHDNNDFILVLNTFHAELEKSSIRC